MKKLELNKETRVVCPKCGTEFEIADKTHVATGVVIGKDSNLGTIHPKVANQKAAERIEALRQNGVDVSNLFSMTGANGGDFVVRNEGGNISILADDDPIFASILNGGAVPNGNLFRRWVMAQMFRMLYWETNTYTRWRHSITEQIRRKGYDYMCKQLYDEFYAQSKMFKNNDSVNLKDRSRWFNKGLVVDVLNDYLSQLRKHINNLPVKKCKGIPYKNICGDNVFITDIERKVYAPIHSLIIDAKKAENPCQLVNTLFEFNYGRKRRSWNPVPCKEWIDAYKGAGAFFTMQNMIRFHGCLMVDDSGRRLDKNPSYAYLELKAKQYEGEGWRMIGLLRKLLKDNNVDIEKKREEWRKNR